MKISFFVFIFFLNNYTFANQIECVNLITPDFSAKFFKEVSGLAPFKKDGTSGFIEYGYDLLEKNEMGDKELVHFIGRLENSELKNPILQIDRGTKSKSLVAYETFQEYIDNASLDHKQILLWAKESLSKLRLVDQQKEVVKTATVNPHEKIEFHHIPAGTYYKSAPTKKAGLQFGSNSKSEQVTLPYDFAMMSTPVTQYQWAELMGENPSYFSYGVDVVALNINGINFRLQPNNPVENITWWSALEFVNRLSARDGLEPVYDFSGVTGWVGRAEDGSLEAKSGVFEISNEKNGYRLPTDDEWEYVIRSLGKTETKYLFGDNEKDIIKYAWYMKNSEYITHLVGTLDPFIINNNKFYDLYGNINEWTSSQYKNSRYETVRLDGLIEVDAILNYAIKIRGGDYSSDKSDLDYSSDSYDFSYDQDSIVGLRVVKTITEGLL